MHILWLLVAMIGGGLIGGIIGHFFSINTWDITFIGVY